MNLTQLLQLSGARIIGGGTYGLNTFGGFSWTANLADQNDQEIIFCIYDTNTLEVYAIEVVHPTEPFAVKWVSSTCSDVRSTELDIAYDDVVFHRVSETQIIEFIKHFVRLDYSIVDKFKVWQHLLHS